MKGVQIAEVGGPEVLIHHTDLPTPSPKENELVIKNAFIGVNFIDTYIRSGLYPSPKPKIVGQEASGTVAAVGSGNTLGFKEGDRIVWMNTGSYAEYTAVPATKVVKIPEGISSEDAIGAFLMGMTALSLVTEAYKVQKGDWIMLHAAAGGVGLLMCQILKKLGAKTIATAGGAAKVKMAESYGADVVVDYKDGNVKWLDVVKEKTNGEGVACVYDSVGKDTWEDTLEAVKRKGAVVFYGASSGAVPPFPVQRLALKNIHICRPSLPTYTVTREEFEWYANELFKWMKAGDLKVTIHKTYDLKDARTAHEDLEGRKTTGKVLLKP